MNTFCSLVVIALIIWALSAVINATLEQNKKIKELINSRKRALEHQIHTLKSTEDAVDNTVKEFFKREDGNYREVYEQLNALIKNMQSIVPQMKNANEKLAQISREEDQSAYISELESQAIGRARHILEGLKNFEQKVYALPSSEMMDENAYGKINKRYWDSINGLKRTMVVSYIDKCQKMLDSTQFDDIFTINIEEVLRCVWFFAMEKVFSASDFQKAESVFCRVYKYNHADAIIADLYAKKKVGGEDVLRENVRNWLKAEGDSHKLTLIASGLMWMNAYQSENMVLQHMLTNGKEMNAKTQERLHSLTSGGGKAPSGFDVSSFGNLLYFDVSALAWKDVEYMGLFDNLAFQDKTLMYSLAVRDENQELNINQGIEIPRRTDILRKFKAMFDEEYGSCVKIQEADCIALSGSGKEKMEGILVSSDECRQMGIVIYISRIGRKLSIKFYTLFMPTGADLKAQKQQALSIYNKLSPSVTVWESSLKDTMLRALEQLLNSGTTAEFKNISAGDRAASEEPVF